MKKVLIVSYYFPPINMIAAKRFGTMCKYFESYGYEPFILTTKHNRSVWLNVKMDLEVPIDRNHILEIGKAGSNNMVNSLVGKIILNTLEKRHIKSRTINANAIGWFEYVRDTIEIKQLPDIDIIIGTFPPMEDLFVTRYLAKKMCIPYLVDIRDLISDYTETIEGYKPATKLDCIIEKEIITKSEGIITVTPGFRDILRKRYPNKKSKVVFNGWSTSPKINEEENTERKYLYYAGSLYSHRVESFELLIKCLKKINNNTEDKIYFIVRSIGPAYLDAQAKKIVYQEKMQAYVSILEATSEDIVRQEQERAFINVVLSTVHEQDKSLMTTIPGKVYELMAEDKPVLAIVSNKSDVAKVLHYTEKGIATISENEIIEFISDNYKRYVGNNRISYFSRKKQAERLCKFMDKVLNK